MKKGILFASICFLAFSVFGQTTKGELKFFRGIGYKIAGSAGFYVPMQNQLSYVDTQIGSITGLKLVGHSQGGLRAISYAGYLKNNGRAANMDTVISIGGPVLGFSPLVQGVGVLKNKVDRAVDTLNNGWQAVINLNDKPKGTDEVLSNGGIEGLLAAFQLKDSGFVNGLDDFIEVAKHPEGTSIPDMIPGSNFMKNNVMEQKITWTWVRRGWFCYPVGKVEKIWKLPAETKYGFVVGQDSDPLKLADEMLDGGLEVYKDNNWTIKTSTKNLKDLYCLATGVSSCAWYGIEVYNNVLKACAWFKWWDRSDYRRYKRYANNAREWRFKANDGKDWAKNYEARFAALLGTGVKGHDCFIPARDQYIDVQREFGGNYVDKISQGKFTGTSATFNHLNEEYHEEIWGSGPDHGLSSDKGVFYEDGKLYKWLYDRNVTGDSCISGVTVK